MKRQPSRDGRRPGPIRDSRRRGHSPSPSAAAAHAAGWSRRAGSMTRLRRGGSPSSTRPCARFVRLTMQSSPPCHGRRGGRNFPAFCGRCRWQAGARALQNSLSRYLDSLLCYGNAAGEVISDHKRGEITGLYNAALSDIEVRPGDSPMERRIFSRHGGFDLRPAPYPAARPLYPLVSQAGAGGGPPSSSPACPSSPRCCSKSMRPPARTSSGWAMSALP